MHRIVLMAVVTGAAGLWVFGPAIEDSRAASTEIAGSIVGIERFPDEMGRAKRMLYDHGFVVTAETKPHIHLFYRGLSEEVVRALSDPSLSLGQREQRLAELVLPPFVTSDAMLHAYFTLFSDELIRLERRQACQLRELLRSWWAVGHVHKPELGPVQEEWTRAMGVLAVARRLVEPAWRDEKPSLPGWVDQETRRVLEAREHVYSAAWDRQVEYAAFRPRGAYAGNVELEQYFRARVWLSRFPLRLDREHEVCVAAVMAVLLPLEAPYESLVHAHRLFLGDPEGQDLGGLAHTMREVIPDAILPSLDAQALRQGLAAVRAELKKAGMATARTGDAPQEITDAGVHPGLYILPPLYLHDSEILTRTTQGALAERLPGGLDVMAGLGCNVARDLLFRCTPEPMRPILAKQLDAADTASGPHAPTAEVAELTYDVFRALTGPVTRENTPPFMRTEAYGRKSLQTALAAWAEYRHAWVLHATKVSVFGADELPPVGFVEPNPEFWDRLLRLTVAARDAFVSASQEADAPRWDSFATAVLRCRLITERQLRDQVMTRSDREFLMTFGDRLARLLGFHTALDTPGNAQALVTDLAYDVLNRRVVHVGTGLPQAMYAVVPYRGKRWLCKGGVMTYREYVTDIGRVLTNEQWRNMLESEAPPPQPEWTKGFCSPPATGTLKPGGLGRPDAE